MKGTGFTGREKKMIEDEIRPEGDHLVDLFIHGLIAHAVRRAGEQREWEKLGK